MMLTFYQNRGVEEEWPFLLQQEEECWEAHKYYMQDGWHLRISRKGWKTHLLLLSDFRLDTTLRVRSYLTLINMFYQETW